jgi:AcrR family transcriptional regulator
VHRLLDLLPDKLESAEKQRGATVSDGSTDLPRRVPRREPLSRRRIAHAALGLLDEQGIGGVTMRAVAQRLDVEAMSLYRYVTGRDAMLDAVIEAIVDELADDPEVTLKPAGPWPEWLAGMAHAVRRYSRHHPRAFPLITTHPSSSPWLNPPLRSPRWVEALLAGLVSQGFDDEDAVFAYRVFSTFLLGYLVLETAALAASLDAPSDEEPGSGLEPGAFPTITRLATSLAEDRWDREFQTGVTAMIERIEAQLSSESVDGRRPPVR